MWILSFLNLCHAVDPVFLAPLPRPHCRQTPSQGHINGSRPPHGRSNGFFYRRSRLPAVPALQPAVCLHRAQHAPLPHAQRPTSQANGTPTSPTGATPAGKSHHKATAMAQGIPPAAALASYRRSRLPFDRLQTLKTLKTLKMPRRPFACIALCR